MPSSTRTGKPSDGRIVVEGADIRLTTPEGKDLRMPIRTLFEKAWDRMAPTDGAVLPNEVVMTMSLGSVVIWVLQSPPCRRRLRWVAADSPAPYGPAATYRHVTIALPYVTVLGVYGPQRGGGLSLTDGNEAFFRNAPLLGVDDELCFPALLNCSKFPVQAGNPLSWICTQHLHRSFESETDPGKRMRLGMQALLTCLYDTGFNYSSEHNEGASWFTESRGVDERIATIEAWEDASRGDPLFPLEVPWLPTGHTVKQVAARIFERHKAGRAIPDCAAAVAKLITNHAAENATPSPDELLPF